MPEEQKLSPEPLVGTSPLISRLGRIETRVDQVEVAFRRLKEELSSRLVLREVRYLEVMQDRITRRVKREYLFSRLEALLGKNYRSYLGWTYHRNQEGRVLWDAVITDIKDVRHVFRLNALESEYMRRSQPDFHRAVIVMCMTEAAGILALFQLRDELKARGLHRVSPALWRQYGTLLRSIADLPDELELVASEYAKTINNPVQRIIFDTRPRVTKAMGSN